MTTANLYCSRGDVTKRLPIGTATSPGGMTASSLASSDALTLDGHGLETDDTVTVRALEGGTLPTPLDASTTYYAIRVDHATFKLAASAGGSAVNLTTNGTDVFVVREPDYDTWIEFYSRWADSFLPQHLVPMGVDEAVHPLVRGIVADLTAKRVLNVAGQDSAVLNTAELAAKAQLERFAKGIPLRGASTTASANRAIVSTYSGTTTDPRGWGSGSLP